MDNCVECSDILVLPLLKYHWWNAGCRECEGISGSVHCLLPSLWWQHCHSTADGCKRL